MASKDTKIKNLIIELSGKDVTLTMAQAKELQSALNELFAEKVRVEKEYVPRPYPVPEPHPVWPYGRPWRPWRREPWITWTDDVPMCKLSMGTTLLHQGESLRCQLQS